MSGPPRTRIQELVAEARKALDLRERLASDGRDPSEVDEALEGLYRDIGKAVVAAAQKGLLIPDAPSLPREGFTDELPEDADEDWYTDEAAVRSASGPLFEPGELSDETDVPEAEALGRSDLRRSLDETDPGGGVFVVETTATMAARARDDLASGLAQLAGGVHAAWKPELLELLELLALPASFDDPKELSVEASRVQWAASEVAYRLAAFPDDLRVCLIGLLAARAQHLRTRLDVDVGLRISLDHLQRYRIEQELASVPGLLPNPQPERGRWEDDVRAWWALLHPAVS